MITSNKSNPFGRRHINSWLGQMFKAGQVNKGGLVRRAVKSVEKYGGGQTTLVAEAKARGFLTGDQFLVMCHPGVQKIVC